MCPLGADTAVAVEDGHVCIHWLMCTSYVFIYTYQMGLGPTYV